MHCTVGDKASLMVHNGFLMGAELELAHIIEQLALRPVLPLWLTGHSLGGAYAMCTCLLMHAQPAHPFAGGTILKRISFGNI